MLSYTSSKFVRTAATRVASINHAHEDGTNGAYQSRSPGRHRSDRSDIVRDGRLLDTPERRGDEYRYYSSYGSDRHHDHHHYHPYRRNARG